MTGRQNLIRSVGFLVVLALVAVLAPAARAVEPCCNVTAINRITGVVTAKETATRRTFQFKLNNAKQLAGLKVGQAVTADFKTGKVTVRVAGAEPVGGKIHGAEPVGTKIHGLEPCCNITAINWGTGVVTARATATGRTFQFKVTNVKALGALKVGQAVAADFKTGKVAVRLAGAEPVSGIIQK